LGLAWAALPGGLAHVNPLLKFPAGRRATTRLAARQVRRRHRITVIRPTGAPQTRSTTDRRECAGCGPLLPVALDCIATRTGPRVPVRRAWADRRHDAHAVLTGLLDRPALYGVLAEIEGLGLDVLEVCQLIRTANHQDQVTPADGGGR
jgi:hypothetical protein